MALLVAADSPAVPIKTIALSEARSKGAGNAGLLPSALGLYRGCCRHPRKMRGRSAQGPPPPRSGRGSGADAGGCAARAAVAVVGRHHRIEVTVRLGRAGDGEAGRCFHACSPFKGGWFRGKCPPSQIERGKRSPTTFREGAEYFFAGFLPRNNTWRPLENTMPSLLTQRTIKNMLAYPK